jgi:hypothetical protein
MSMKFYKFFPESNTAIIGSIAEAQYVRNWVWRQIAEEGSPAADKVVLLTNVGIQIENESCWELDFKALWDKDDNGDWYLEVYQSRLVLDSPFARLDIFLELPASWFEYSPQQKSIEQIYGIL